MTMSGRILSLWLPVMGVSTGRKEIPMRHQVKCSLLVMCVLMLGASPGCGWAGAPKDFSTEELAQRLATDSAFLPLRTFLTRFTPEEKVPTLDAVARCPGLSAIQRAARVLCVSAIKWGPGTEAALGPLQGLIANTCDKLANAKEKELLEIAQAWSENYAKLKDRQDELNKLEMELNEQIAKGKARDVRAAEDFFNGGEDGRKKATAAERDLAQAFVKVLKAHPDLEKKLQAALRPERAALTKELQASRDKVEEAIRNIAKPR
jgi:hypothetical protein